MRLKLTLLLVVIPFSLLWPQNYKMVVHLEDGTKRIFPVPGIRKATFRKSMTTSVSVRDPAMVIKTFKLFQNYPNPYLNKCVI